MLNDILNDTDFPFRRQCLPFYIREVLQRVFYRHSTTASIRKMSGFKLEVMCHEPYRDVKIKNGNNLFMYARTQAPETTQKVLRGIYSFQKPAPIGDFLFHASEMGRVNTRLHLSAIIPETIQAYENQQRVYWVRETIWLYKRQYPIQLIEIFF